MTTSSKTQVDKGSLIQHFEYRKLTWGEHYMHVIAFIVYVIILMIASLFMRNDSLSLFLVASSLLAFMMLLWIPRYYEENSLTTYSIYENGIDVHIHKRYNKVEKPRPKREIGTYWYTWEQVKGVRLISPFDRHKKGLRHADRWELRTGIQLEFTDGFVSTVYQRPEPYGAPCQPWFGTFYKALHRAGLSNIQSTLPVYDRLSVHGQHKDGSKSEFFNNGGKPAEEIKIW